MLSRAQRPTRRPLGGPPWALRKKYVPAQRHVELGGRALLKRPTLRPASVMEEETRPTRYLAVLGKWALYGSKCTVCYGWVGAEWFILCRQRQN